MFVISLRRLADCKADTNSGKSSMAVLEPGIGKEVVLSIILPVRNDAPSVNIMVRILSALIEVPFEMLVVYDDPNDTAAPIVEQMRTRYANLSGLLNAASGVLNAVRVGVSAARGRYVLIYAADEIGPALAIDRMLHLMQRGCDFVSATRYRGGGRRYGGSILGHMLSRMANALFCLASVTALSDCTTGIKMFRRDLFTEFVLTDVRGSGWSFAFEMAIRAQLMDLRLGEVPVVSIDRLFGGTSTFNLIPWLVSYSKWFVWGVRKLPPWHRPPPSLAIPIERYAS
jgi:dolichol-phosphate mannosyltransferase